MSLFVDTSALYALLVETEDDHAGVRRAFGQAAERGRRLLTTNYVLVESSALLQSRIGLAPVRDLDAKIVPILDVLYVDAGLHRRALDRLFTMDRRRVSLVDAISFEVMEAEGITDALSLDPDFTSEGFRLIP